MSIYVKVINAMNKAEEMGGPLGDEYMKLMTNIAHEALDRMVNYRTGTYLDDLKMDIQPKPKPTQLTLEAFRKTGRNVVFKDEPDLAGYDIECFMGRVYANNCWIGLLDNGNWWLQISNEEYEGHLDDLEERLYNDWYVHET